MKELPEFELLQDLARLLRKHGPGAFEKLAQQLSEPAFIDQLRQALSSFAQAAREGRRGNGPATKAPARQYRTLLLDQEQLGPEKSALLVRLYDEMLAKTLLPTMSELRAFAASSGLPLPKSSARQKAVVEMFEFLRERSLEDLQRIASRVSPAGGNTDRSLENWARIIFDKELRSKKAE